MTVTLSEPVDPLFGVGLERPTEVKARDLELSVVTVDRFRDVNYRWHSRLPEIPMSSVVGLTDVTLCYAAVSESFMFAVALWTRPVASNRLSKHWSHYLELRRMATSQDRPANTATRFLRLMRTDIAERLPEVCMLLSYQDTEVHLGTIYKADNWQQSWPEAPPYESWQSNAPTANGYKVGRKGKTKVTQQSTAPKMRWEYQLRRCHEV